MQYSSRTSARLRAFQRRPSFITPYEYSLFDAEAFAAGTEHKSLAQIISHYVGELDLPAKRESICKLLIAVLYGAPVIVKACAQSNGLEAAYQENVGLIFCGLGALTDLLKIDAQSR